MLTAEKTLQKRKTLKLGKQQKDGGERQKKTLWRKKNSNSGNGVIAVGSNEITEMEIVLCDGGNIDDGIASNGLTEATIVLMTIAQQKPRRQGWQQHGATTRGDNDATTSTTQRQQGQQHFEYWMTL